MMPQAPGGPSMTPPGAPAAKAEAAKPKEPEPPKPADLSDDPFASEKAKAPAGKPTPTGALGRALLKGVMSSASGGKPKGP